MEPVLINASDLTAEEISQLRSMGFEVAEQGSPEWLEERLGIPTASRFHDIIDWTAGSAPKKDGTVTTPPKPKATYYTYMNQLVAERLTGKQGRFLKTLPMQWGNQHEEQAATIYQEITGFDVREVGFIRSEEIDAGASLDRIVDEKGCLEIKCPNTSTHVAYLEDGAPPQYISQMQGQMWIGNKEWCDFMSYDPEMPENSQIFLRRYYRDEEFIKDMIDKITKFIVRVDQKEERLREFKLKES